MGCYELVQNKSARATRAVQSNLGLTPQPLSVMARSGMLVALAALAAIACAQARGMMTGSGMMSGGQSGSGGSASDNAVFSRGRATSGDAYLAAYVALALREPARLRASATPMRHRTA